MQRRKLMHHMTLLIFVCAACQAVRISLPSMVPPQRCAAGLRRDWLSTGASSNCLLVCGFLRNPLNRAALGVDSQAKTPNSGSAVPRLRNSGPPIPGQNPSRPGQTAASNVKHLMFCVFRIQLFSKGIAYWRGRSWLYTLGPGSCHKQCYV